MHIYVFIHFEPFENIFDNVFLKVEKEPGMQLLRLVTVPQ